MPKSTFNPAYKLLLEALVDVRRQSGVTQVELSKKLGKPQSFVSNLERGNRRVDLLEFYAIVRALGGDPETVIVAVLRQLPKKVAI